MEKILKRIYILVATITFILLPLLGYILVLSILEKHVIASLSYGIAVFVWGYVAVQFIKIANILARGKDE